jgi:hypothetical protein
MTLRAIGRSDPAVSHEQRRAIAQRFIELDDKLRDIDEHRRRLGPSVTELLVAPGIDPLLVRRLAEYARLDKTVGAVCKGISRFRLTMQESLVLRPSTNIPVLVTRNFWRCLPKSAAVPEVAQAQLDLHGSAGTDRVWNTCSVRQKSLRGANVASYITYCWPHVTDAKIEDCSFPTAS